MLQILLASWCFCELLFSVFKVTIQLQEGMVEFIGVLKITIFKGTNLAVRDMLSSDPYVVLTLGKQVSNFLFSFGLGTETDGSKR